MQQSSSSFMMFCVYFTLIMTNTRCTYHDELCIESRHTTQEVQSCPRTKPLWDDRERRKNCSSIVHKCSRELVYHCVINPWQNMTLEVCVPVTEINDGFCAEYNMKGGRIQDYFERSCSKCEKNYISTDAYLYTECYDAAYERRNIFTYMYVTSSSITTTTTAAAAAATTTRTTRIEPNLKSSATTIQPMKLVLLTSLTVFVFAYYQKK